MPVEIKELVVRAVVRSPESRVGQSGQNGQCGSAGAAPSAAAGGLSDDDREALVAASAREVLRILECAKAR